VNQKYDKSGYPHKDHYLEHFEVSPSKVPKVTLSTSKSPMVLLSYTATQYVQTTSAIFRKQFGIGSSAWRLLVVLFRHPHSSSNEISRFVRTDKAAVSRTLNLLMEQGYIQYAAQPDDERIKVWSLTESGELLHDRMLAVSTNIYEYLLSGLEDQDIDTLRQCLQVLSKKIDQLPKKILE